MSYCRFSDGDVYMFWNVGGYIDCCGCTLVPFYYEDEKREREINPNLPKTKFITIDDAIAHLDLHRENGDNVPNYAYVGLEQDREEFEEEMKRLHGENYGS